MARKRLSPPQETYLAAVPETKAMAGPFGPLPHHPAPIAQVAGDSALSAALREVTDELHAARAEGRLVQRLPLGSIEADHLVRDRIAENEDEMQALLGSIRARGQQTPIEVVDLGAGRYGLISGWRRLRALAALHEETGESRFATVQALLRRPRGGLGCLSRHGRGKRDPRRPRPLRTRPHRGPRGGDGGLPRPFCGAAPSLSVRQPRKALQDRQFRHPLSGARQPPPFPRRTSGAPGPCACAGDRGRQGSDPADSESADLCPSAVAGRGTGPPHPRAEACRHPSRSAAPKRFFPASSCTSPARPAPPASPSPAPRSTRPSARG